MNKYRAVCWFLLLTRPPRIYVYCRNGSICWCVWGANRGKKREKQSLLLLDRNSQVKKEADAGVTDSREASCICLSRLEKLCLSYIRNHLLFRISSLPSCVKEEEEKMIMGSKGCAGVATDFLSCRSITENYIQAKKVAFVIVQEQWTHQLLHPTICAR